MWVFGYGSLMWKPGFPLAERRMARLMGYARTFCMRSIHHRGTPERPGLVLALDQTEKAWCDGIALRVSPGHEDETLAYLRERELISAAYLERRLPVVLEGGGEVEALCYVVDADHVQYCGGLDLEEQARIIAGAEGGMGPNDEYLINTVTHLDEMGIHDPDLQWLVRRVRNYHQVP
ncbi:gamma-glutamylcyclotransferase [Aquicoccus porphyridii]|uniref:glutathione-specific gamma-glutamylcyclotransferase n=1 Tax=Aquicoccus porphyridii TaxID=1852029 RepID=A0A5A9Z4E5_9RHOB|nr:gamma-glutamylcyclotransferase [Aquicoccus porphyridii]KAA0912066.1 gamma-glutamylcyclotransferase [Aquicoccus porphyridii]RAI53079.1 gamma-glutamylcyclotransferase [Rhodobacteraceae bacterium AsT-22]